MPWEGPRVSAYTFRPDGSTIGPGVSMGRRIGIWALAGFAVAGAWVLLSLVIDRRYNLGKMPVVALTAPAALLGRRVPQSWYGFIFLNTALYALLGLGAEVARRLLHYSNR